jgi:ABC-type dipeptide/oligopeptide/nickel transport system permease subunit
MARSLSRHPGQSALAIGLGILAVIVFAAIFADWVSPFDPLRANPLARYKGVFSG